ncbi:hypothetical protein, partial [Bosea massiliensis]
GHHRPHHRPLPAHRVRQLLQRGRVRRNLMGFRSKYIEYIAGNETSEKIYFAWAQGFMNAH